MIGDPTNPGELAVVNLPDRSTARGHGQLVYVKARATWSPVFGAGDLRLVELLGPVRVTAVRRHGALVRVEGRVGAEAFIPDAYLVPKREPPDPVGDEQAEGLGDLVGVL